MLLDILAIVLVSFALCSRFMSCYVRGSEDFVRDAYQSVEPLEGYGPFFFRFQ